MPKTRTKEEEKKLFQQFISILSIFMPFPFRWLAVPGGGGGDGNTISSIVQTRSSMGNLKFISFGAIATVNEVGSKFLSNAPASGHNKFN